MTSRSTLSAAAVLAMLWASSAVAAPVLGSNVDSSLFSSTLGSTTGWTYSGDSTSAFASGGTATLVSRSSSYANSFGYSNLAHTGRTNIFAAGAGVGTTSLVTGYAPSYLFYFQADGSDSLIFSDDNRQYTDGYDSGSFPGEGQGGIDIFFNAASSTWAFFFDDAGGGFPILGDDNDYDDMVVTFQTASQPNGVPEPMSLLLVGAGLLGLGAMRRKQSVKHAA